MEGYCTNFRKLQSAPGESPAYSSPPPTYPCIRGRMSPVDNNLFDNYVAMQADEVEASEDSLRTSGWEEYDNNGKVMTLEVFYAFSS
jgi:hypothetical protein